MDQIAALHRVKRHLVRFGGDPASVTLFGESAGAGSVQIRMTLPAPRALFPRLFAESGAGGSALLPIRMRKRSVKRGLTTSALKDATPDQRYGGTVDAGTSLA